VLVDLHAPGSVALVSALKARAPALPVVGFFSHVETALRRDALAAGADAVLPRSQFVGRLAALLARGLDALREPPAAAARRGELVEDEAALTAIAHGMKSVAVVGIKDGRDPDAPAYEIPKLFADAGVRVIGVNPKVKTALGQPTLGSLAELREAPDVVDVFRRPEAIPELAEELLALPADRMPGVVWLQSGIRHDAAAARLVAAGYRVVQDRCLGVYSRRTRRGG
jgi:predicted CoA-binding protein